MRRLFIAAFLLAALSGCGPKVPPPSEPPFKRVSSWAELEARGDVASTHPVKLLLSDRFPGRDAVTFEHHGETLRLRLVSASEDEPEHAVIEVNGIAGRFDREIVYEIPGAHRLLFSAMDMESHEPGVMEADVIVVHLR